VVLLQNSRRGLFVGCSAYPACDYTRPWDSLPPEGIALGTDPQTKHEIVLFKGPFGYYVQSGRNAEGAKPKRAAWPKEWPVPREPSDEALQRALRVLSLPRALGVHPQTRKPVEASVGRFGPYVKHDGAFKSIPKSESVYEITLERALGLLAAPKNAPGGGGRDLGPHPIDRKPVSVMSGRYGPYVKHGQVNVTIPSDVDPSALTLDDAVDLLAEKAARELAKTGSTARPVVLETRRGSNAKGRRGVPQAGGKRGRDAGHPKGMDPRMGTRSEPRSGGGLSRSTAQASKPRPRTTIIRTTRRRAP
jgi:DNA topoisomerase-1